MKNVFVPPREPAPKQNSIAFVAGVIEDGLILRMAGEAEPRQKAFMRLASYASPAEGDKVYIVPISGTYLVIGKVV